MIERTWASKAMRPIVKPANNLRKKVRHYDEPNHAHFLTFSCYRRWPLLSKDRTRWMLVESIEEARAKHSFHLWGWVIMPEHVHLLVWPRKAGDKMSIILADIKRPVGQKAIAWLVEHRSRFVERLTVRTRTRKYRRFWQAGPGQDRSINEPRAAHDSLEYIHDNPVQRDLVSHPYDWLWSSAADWSGKSETPLRVDRTMPNLVVVDAQSNRRTASQRPFPPR